MEEGRGGKDSVHAKSIFFYFYSLIEIALCIKACIRGEYSRTYTDR